MDKSDRGESVAGPQMRVCVSKTGEQYVFWHINGLSLYCEGEAAEVAITFNLRREQVGLGII